MKIVSRLSDGQPVLELKSPLVGEEAARELAQAMQRALETESFDVALDLRQVGTIDSVGLEAVLACHEQCKKLGGACKLVNVSPRMRRILTLTRLDRELETEAAS